MNAWANAVAFLLVNIFHWDAASGGSVNDPINTCKYQDPPLYQTEWDLDFTNRKPECVQQCLEQLPFYEGAGLIWEGCYHHTTCDNYCKCTVDSDIIVNGYATFLDAVGNLRRPTEVFKSWFAERYEGTMYVAYDCRQSKPMGFKSKSMRGYKSKTGRDRSNGGRRHSSKRSRFPYWR